MLNYDSLLERESYNKFRKLCIETGMRHLDRTIEDILLKEDMEKVHEFIC